MSRICFYFLHHVLCKHPLIYMLFISYPVQAVLKKYIHCIYVLCMRHRELSSMQTRLKNGAFALHLFSRSGQLYVSPIPDSPIHCDIIPISASPKVSTTARSVIFFTFSFSLIQRDHAVDGGTMRKKFAIQIVS